MKNKLRLDLLIAQQHPTYSRNQIQSLIMQGKVRVNGQVITKAGIPIDTTALITLDITQERFVCRAGAKLEHALNYFNIDVTGLTILDAGISTGGFTDCLLQQGAKKVYGVDVGYGQVHEKIRGDSRVILHEKTNLRHLRDIGEQVDLITLDLSFISLLKQPKTAGAHLVLVRNPAHHPDGDFALSDQQVLAAGTERYTYAGFGAYHPDFFREVPQAVYPLKPLLDRSILAGEVTGEYFCGDWLDVGTPERYQELQSRFITS